MGILDKITEGVTVVASKMADAVSDVVEAVTASSDAEENAGQAGNQTKGTANNAPAKAVNGTIRVQYYRSVISTPKTHKQIVRSIGLTKLNQIVERPDTDSIRGIVKKVPHLLRIVE